MHLLPKLKTTGTRLVWRTRPCGTEGNAACNIKTFQSLTTYVQVWVRTQQLLPSLMRKKIYCSRTSSLSEEVKIDKDVVAAVLRGTCETLSTSRSYKSVLTESVPDTLLSRIWKVFLRPNSDLAPVVGGALCSNRLSIDLLHLSDNTKCHRSSCRVVSTFVQTLWLKTGWILRLVFC